MEFISDSYFSGLLIFILSLPALTASDAVCLLFLAGGTGCDEVDGCGSAASSPSHLAEVLLLCRTGVVVFQQK